MTWAKLDDQFHAHPKVKRAWKAHPRAVGLHVLAIAYCAAYLTDGHIPAEFVEEKVPQKRERHAVTLALTGSGLWAHNGDGWQINDYLDFNPSRSEVEATRRARAEAGRLGGLASKRKANASRGA